MTPVITYNFMQHLFSFMVNPSNSIDKWEVCLIDISQDKGYTLLKNPFIKNINHELS